MTVSLGFYSDAGLTTPLALAQATQAADGSAPAVDLTMHLGSTIAGKKFEAFSNPGIDDIYLSIASGGAGIPASAIKLALSAGGLATASAGAPLAIDTVILSGSANSVPVYVRIDAAAIAVGRYENLSLALDEVLESAA